MRSQTVTAIMCFGLICVAASSAAPGTQVDLPGIRMDTSVPDWLPGIWQPFVDVAEGDSRTRADGFFNRYQFVVNDDGFLEVSRWQEILPGVDVAFFDGASCVLQESWAGETREFTLNLDSMAVRLTRPSMEGVLRVENEDDGEPDFYRVVWRKLPDDFFDDAL